MKFVFQVFIGWVVFILIAPTAYADNGPASGVAQNCKVEYESYCKDVTPGKGRVLACLYAYSDKASEQCRDSVREAYDDLKLLSAAASHLQNECEDDIAQFCREVAPGEGRILSCLEKNEEKLSKQCITAMKEIGVRD